MAVQSNIFPLLHSVKGKQRETGYNLLSFRGPSSLAVSAISWLPLSASRSSAGAGSTRRQMLQEAPRRQMLKHIAFGNLITGELRDLIFA